MATENISKEDKLILTAECSLNIILKHGLQGLTFARLARAAKVSRPWLYKYVGKSDEDIINFAIDHFGRMFAHLDRPTEKERTQWIDAIIQGTARMFQNVERYPWIMPLYFRYYATPTTLGERIGYIKGLYLNKVTQEVSSCYKKSKSSAQQLAEMVTDFQLTMAFHWPHYPEHTKEAHDRALHILRTCLEAIK